MGILSIASAAVGGAVRRSQRETSDPSEHPVAERKSMLGLGDVTRQVSPAPEEPKTTEQRAVPRRDALLVPAITGLRLSPQGADATLLNISTTGLLAECGVRMRLGSAVPVFFEGKFSPKAVDGRVMRSSVAKLNKSGGLRYQVGIAFRQSIPLQDSPAAGAGIDPPPVDTLAAPQVVRNRW
jgi:hypothetical protein